MKRPTPGVGVFLLLLAGTAGFHMGHLLEWDARAQRFCHASGATDPAHPRYNAATPQDCRRMYVAYTEVEHSGPLVVDGYPLWIEPIALTVVVGVMFAVYWVEWPKVRGGGPPDEGTGGV